jgi:hypothetical protein
MSTIEIIKKSYPLFLKAKLAGVNNERVVLPAGRGLWPALFQAVKPSKGENDPKKFQYSISLLIPAEADISALEARVKTVFEENVPEKQRAAMKWRNPILKTADEMPAMADEYPILLRLNSKQWQRNGTERARPDVFDAKRVAIPSDPGPHVVYHGRWVQPVINPFWYPATQGSAGVSLGLLSTQLLWHDTNDTPIAGGRVDTSGDYEVVEGLDETPEVDEYA